MPDPNLRFDQMIAALKEGSFRLTPQRVELVRLIAASEEHPSASRLYTKIKDRFPTMSPATVYKTLALLKELDQVMEIDLHADNHYDGNRLDPHSHLICTNCHKIVDEDINLEPSAIRKLEQASGFRIVRPQLAFYGLCPDCWQTSK
jgi:Fur family transcriptional regulator, peroxide stress response regulator